MGLPEYTRRRVDWFEKDTLRVLTTSDAPPLKASRPRKRKPQTCLDSGTKRPKLRLTETARNADVTDANQSTIETIFSFGEKPKAQPSIPLIEEEAEELAALEEDCTEIPASNLTPSQLENTTENWNSQRGNLPPCRSKVENCRIERREFVSTFRSRVSEFFQGNDILPLDITRLAFHPDL